MNRTRMIGWTAFAVCLLGYAAAAAAAVLFLNRAGDLPMRESILIGGAAAVIGEIGLWVAAGCLGWSLFRKRKALFDRIVGRKPPTV